MTLYPVSYTHLDVYKRQIFDDTGAWGTDTLKGWIDDYESTRFTATDSHTAVITSEYNMEP